MINNKDFANSKTTKEEDNGLFDNNKFLSLIFSKDINKFQLGLCLYTKNKRTEYDLNEDNFNKEIEHLKVNTNITKILKDLKK